MFKFVILSLALVSAVLAETSFEVVEGQQRLLRASEEPGYVYSYPAPVKGVAVGYAVPPDNGGNFGDNIHKARVAGDRLLTQEVQINAIQNREQTLTWKGNFPGYTISHIRFLNIGRQRAYVAFVKSSGGTAEASVQVAANLQFRLLIEVYGR